mmetsp:Transcript_15286/g.26758  ORF Transcript_15286/g.26758 Transcript_15286/m.26758 type:complete len:297 (-) Transcript_15286:1878-2768(-)
MQAVAKQLEHAGLGHADVEPRTGELELNSERVFVKFGTGGTDAGVEMLEYERLGLEHLRSAAPEVGLKIPQAYLAGEVPGRGGFLCTEHLDLGGRLNELQQRELGKCLAMMHAATPTMHNGFGFPMDGCCGALEQPNNSDGRMLNWLEFYDEYRLGFQLEQAKQRYPNDTEFQELGVKLRKTLSDIFVEIVVEDIQPSILHGDLWAGNVGVAAHATPCIFDPAAYYGHSEADLGIAYMFGGFTSSFFEGYHSVLPKKPGFEKRAKLYELHHHMNHMNIFGQGYRDGCIQLMRQLVQ